MAKRVHIALSVKNLQESINDYTKRLGVNPSFIANDKYALFRTDTINLSITQNIDTVCSLRHLGFEDDETTEFQEEIDVNGIKWEKFNQQQQENEIMEFYPEEIKLSDI